MVVDGLSDAAKSLISYGTFAEIAWFQVYRTTHKMLTKILIYFYVYGIGHIWSLINFGLWGIFMW